MRKSTSTIFARTAGERLKKMNEVRVVLTSGEVCYVRIEIPQDLFTPEGSGAEREYIENWLRKNMNNVKEWSE